ncbi:unnamed protein product [Linum tenue]|uniref:Uncharacterized protein n=1 Tax=Linum tenue TaxID=586396 RepID=A0AAV0KN31_9ROSI|nr:unnamed protein product [Linum tenue]CAI0423429.1 unnamed protein product [Linum tenue]
MATLCREMWSMVVCGSWKRKALLFLGRKGISC